MKQCLAICALCIAIFIGIIHISPPHLTTKCILLGVSCPNIKFKTIHNKNQKNRDFELVGKSIKHWIETGEEIASQINIRIKGKEVYSLYAADSFVTNDKFDEKSLVTMWSNSKTFASLMIGIAVQSEWIHSYNDPITKYWPRFPTNKGKYNIKISDVLRHEGGLCVYDRYRIVYDLWNINTANYKIIKHAIEDERITFFGDSKRCYHTISRGHILNEIFHSVEPKSRYMAQYFENEILPYLMHKDPSFGLTFRGLRFVNSFNNPSVFNEDRVFDVELPSFLWELYHVKFPKYVLKRPVLSDQMLTEKICKFLPDKEQKCPKQNVNIDMKIFDLALDNVWEMHDSWDYSPKRMSSHFRHMVMEHMSSSGLANAHSMNKAFEFIMHKVLNKETKRLLFSEKDKKFDVALGVNTTFTLGGFGYFEYGSVEFYGWNGWGGSTMIYAPKYDCFVSYTVTGFGRKNYNGDPRRSTIVHLIAEQLKKN